MATNDTAWSSFVEFAEQHGGATFSLAVQEALGLEAIAILRHQAHRGNTVAAKWLAEKWVGAPEASFNDRLNGMSAEEIREELVSQATRRYTRHGIGDDDARAWAEADYPEDGDG